MSVCLRNLCAPNNRLEEHLRMYVTCRQSIVFGTQKIANKKLTIPLTAAVCATHAPKSMGLTGSVLGIVKYPLGFGSQHFATTNLIGLHSRQ